MNDNHNKLAAVEAILAETAEQIKQSQAVSDLEMQKYVILGGLKK